MEKAMSFIKNSVSGLGPGLIPLFALIILIGYGCYIIWGEKGMIIYMGIVIMLLSALVFLCGLVLICIAIKSNSLF